METRNWARILTGTPMVLVWAVGIVLGMSALVRYQMTPDASAQTVPNQWPRGVSFARDGNRLTLVMTLHPECPCSRASLTELAQILSRSEGRVSAHVLFVHPAGAPANWIDSDLWHQAKAIPNVTAILDENGRDMKLFSATTSGEVMVYDASGSLQFAGGITDGRGHEGDNPGMLSILALIRGEKSRVSSTPVYGCSLGISKANSIQR